MVYTERKDGVKPEYDIRTDRFEVALDAHEKIHKGKTAQREQRGKVIDMTDKKDDGKAEPTEGKQP